eukprot:jgi/Botrbrau1/21141/Bobra.0061s0035.1
MNYLGGNLRVSCNGLTAPLSPSMFNNLQFVGGSIIALDNANPPQLRSIGGLANLQQVGGAVLLTRTRFEDMRSFSGLQCVGSLIYISDNPLLGSLDGLNALNAVNYRQIFFNPPTLYVQGNNILGNGGSSITALTKVARCGNGFPPLAPMIKVTGCRKNLTTWAETCVYIYASQCP